MKGMSAMTTSCRCTQAAVELNVHAALFMTTLVVTDCI